MAVYEIEKKNSTLFFDCVLLGFLIVVQLCMHCIPETQIPCKDTM